VKTASSEHIFNVRIIEEYKESNVSETEDHKKCWIHNQFDTLYDFQQCDSSYKIISLRSAQITTSLRLSQSTILYELNENPARKQSFAQWINSCAYYILSKSLHKVLYSLKTILKANHSLWITLTSVKYIHLVIKASVILIYIRLFKFTAIEII
jgi:hypothetical protein